uniref:Thioredoxin domain-containing protein 2 n=1 Tax=Cercocebus atys TaxID=9531 RepID=A0A2K5L9E3_CERAT
MVSHTFHMPTEESGAPQEGDDLPKSSANTSHPTAGVTSADPRRNQPTPKKDDLPKSLRRSQSNQRGCSSPTSPQQTYPVQAWHIPSPQSNAHPATDGDHPQVPSKKAPPRRMLPQSQKKPPTKAGDILKSPEEAVQPKEGDIPKSPEEAIPPKAGDILKSPEEAIQPKEDDSPKSPEEAIPPKEDDILKSPEEAVQPKEGDIPKSPSIQPKEGDIPKSPEESIQPKEDDSPKSVEETIAPKEGDILKPEEETTEFLAGDKVKVILSKEDFEASLKEAGERLVAVDFSATWCGPCRTIKPFFHALSMKHEDVVFLEVDADDCEEVVRDCAIMCVPTFQFYKKEEKVDEFCGALKEKLEAVIAELK